MQYLEDKIKIIIFKHVDYPLNLALTCRKWSVIVKNPYAKSEWLMTHYGKEHALFYAVKLGPTFIDIAVFQNLISRKVLVSRYFIQSLLMHFGKDQKLIELDDVGHLDDDTNRTRAFQQKIESPWTNNLSTYLLDDGCKQLSNANENLLSKGGDMKLFPRIHQSSDLKYPSKEDYLQGYFSRRGHNRRRSQRRSRRRYQLNAPMNNEDTLSRIANLPRQTSNDPSIDQFFNGFSFI